MSVPGGGALSCSLKEPGSDGILPGKTSGVPDSRQSSKRQIPANRPNVRRLVLKGSPHAEMKGSR